MAPQRLGLGRGLLKTPFLQLDEGIPVAIASVGGIPVGRIVVWRLGGRIDVAFIGYTIPIHIIIAGVWQTVAILISLAVIRKTI